MGVHSQPRAGLIVNPIAGMGGRVGLKGTDGPDAVARAVELGAVPLSGARAEVALTVLRERAGRDLTVLTPPGALGEDVARQAGLEPTLLAITEPWTGRSHDTIRAARKIVEAGVDLLLFAGGDGTARDICEVIGTDLPALGIPTGVKMHSSVFPTSPRAAGELAARFLTEPNGRCRESEVMDIDEQAFQDGRVAARLYGYLRVPYERSLVQGLKSGSGGRDLRGLNGIASVIGQRMDDGALWILGPGSTTRYIATALGLEKTLLGVDVYRNRSLLRSDANERDLLPLLDESPARIVVTPIGGQGYLLGRGNQQLSPEVIRRVGKENIIVVAAASKLADLGGAPLLVDTGDPELDDQLSGYIRVMVDQRQTLMQRIA
jgi:predicted polyphosphate/ATP-dependent NAD kinase